MTGATGFVAGHVIGDLFGQGYEVRATVRDLDDIGAHRHLHAMAADARAKLELVHADLGSDAGWDDAAADCEFVLHIASPLPISHDPTGLVRVAVDGTRRVLQAAARASTVRRVVLTSSTLAIDACPARPDGVLTEQDWSETDAGEPYARGKTLAELEAWKFVRALPPDRGLELATILPGNVLGPLQRPAEVTSQMVIRRLLTGAVPGLLRIGWAPVDVRDLAIGHRLAMETPAAAGNRYVFAGPHLWMSEIAEILADEFGAQGYRMPRRTLPDWTVRLAARFDDGLALAVPTLGQTTRITSLRVEQDLGLTLRPARETVMDTAASLIEFGVVPARPPRRRLAAVI
ncbi:NAD-dependent epimerase/dehydratase family protein [Nocardia takedensis]|uniref:NAD-dependent epimerase/dehydratase family protein n=1 Tax=Nocardia takedensis TaxID=259390 RepID=UPI001FDFBED9|nr:NAD-dependent epimerase/dehydratase family protein [Nocardia takedensis]